MTSLRLFKRADQTNFFSLELNKKKNQLMGKIKFIIISKEFLTTWNF